MLSQLLEFVGLKKTTHSGYIRIREKQLRQARIKRYLEEENVRSTDESWFVNRIITKREEQYLEELDNIIAALYHGRKGIPIDSETFRCATSGMEKRAVHYAVTNLQHVLWIVTRFECARKESHKAPEYVDRLINRLQNDLDHHVNIIMKHIVKDPDRLRELRICTKGYEDGLKRAYLLRKEAEDRYEEYQKDLGNYPLW